MKDAVAQNERGVLARLLLDNLPLKLLSAVLSIGLFSLVHGDTDAQRSVYLDVVALLPPPHSDTLLVTDLPHQVKVTLRGSRSRISALQHEDFTPVQMDLRDTSRRFYYFDPAAIDVAGTAQVVSIDPRAVELVWAKSAERKVPSRPRVRGAVDEGYAIRRPVTVTPATVTIRGPEEDVRPITEVFTDDIAIDGMPAGVHERRVHLEPLPGHVSYLDSSSADVRLEVVPEFGERVLRRLTVAVLGPGPATVRPAVVSVVLRGPVRALSDLEPDELVPYVEIGPAAPATGMLALEVKVRGVPDGFQVARVVPTSVLIRRGR